MKSKLLQSVVRRKCKNCGRIFYTQYVNNCLEGRNCEYCVYDKKAKQELLDNNRDCDIDCNTCPYQDCIVPDKCM